VATEAERQFAMLDTQVQQLRRNAFGAAVCLTPFPSMSLTVTPQSVRIP
jgi:hypothetical protein